MKIVSGIMAATLALAGCSASDDASDDGATKDTTAAAAASAKDVFSGAGYKADCLNCTEDGPNAFVQLGLGDRFWKVGDSWQVAYQLRTDLRMQMQPMAFQNKLGADEGAKVEAGLIVLDFRVTEIGSHSTGGIERATATIAITQGEARGSLGELVAGKEIRVDETTRKVELVIDDLLRPVSVTEYTGPRGETPNGLTRQLDPRESLRNLSSAFPYVVPNAYVGAQKKALPALEGAAAALVDAAGVDADREYFHFDLKGYGAESTEQVYWAAGDLWPLLVETPSATGVLVFQNN
jgi:hypothetical protein